MRIAGVALLWFALSTPGQAVVCTFIDPAGVIHSGSMAPQSDWKFLSCTTAGSPSSSPPPGWTYMVTTTSLSFFRSESIRTDRNPVVEGWTMENYDDYLDTALSLLSRHPHLGVIGAGILEPEFEKQPSPELVPYLRILSLRRIPNAMWSNNADDQAAVPWGAGLCVTRSVADAYEQLLGRLNRLNVYQLLDRRGPHLFGNGDVAFSWASVTAGQGFGVFPQLHVVHLISADRVTQQYFLRLAQDSGFSGGVLDYLRTGLPPGDDLGNVERYVRLLLRAIRKGLFAMRFKMAVSRGEDQARAFIAGERLQHFTFSTGDSGRNFRSASLL